MIWLLIISSLNFEDRRNGQQDWGDAGCGGCQLLALPPYNGRYNIAFVKEV